MYHAVEYLHAYTHSSSASKPAITPAESPITLKVPEPWLRQASNTSAQHPKNSWFSEKQNRVFVNQQENT